MFCSLALGLQAKPMLMTLPCVLLLLDFWPLGRMDIGQKINIRPGADLMFNPAGIARLVIEKIPLLALSIGVIVMSISR
jgi:protein O-mannosyl-transferase